MRTTFDDWTMRADLTMLPRGEIVGVMFPRMVWDAGRWTPRGSMLAHKKTGLFKLEFAWVTAEPIGSPE